jgi:hypothetical protein
VQGWLLDVLSGRPLDVLGDYLLDVWLDPGYAALDVFEIRFEFAQGETFEGGVRRDGAT